MKCCYNEEEKKYYELESINPNKFMCLGCYIKYTEDDLKGLEK